VDVHRFVSMARVRCRVVASSHFRAGVVAVVRNPDGTRVLAFERVDPPGFWQLPQGGLKAGETPEQGAWRELAEETGLTDAHVALHSEHPEWLAYEWPAEIRREQQGPHHRIGQTQRWFVFTARRADIEPTPDGVEFGAWQWVTPEWLVAQVPQWRRGPYERVLLAP